MTQRKEVFQSKVLQKLYPQASKQEKDPRPPHVEALARKTLVKRTCQKKTASNDGGMIQGTTNPIRRVYTVLPPPADYKTSLERSATLPQPESINNAENPADESSHESSEKPDQEKEEEEQKRRKRRRKRKAVILENSVKDGSAPLSDSSTGQSQILVDQGRERLSRNKKRKLKKKRHKEKLLSMGLMPQAVALEFTYHRDGDEEEDDERKAAEVSQFLRTTMEIYMSDSSLNVDKLHTLSVAMEDLLSNITSGHKPTSLLKQLYSLKAFVQQKEPDKLSKALDELHSTSSMSPEETTAVVSLFQYWITDILPMQRDTNPSATHP